MTLRLKQVVALVAAVGTLLTGSALYAQQKAISIATGGTGGVYYPLGGGMANILSKYLPGIQATAEVTGGSVDNLKLIGTNRAEVAFSMMDAALDAVNGVDKFSAGKIPVRTLMVLYPNRMHVVSIEGTGINKMADLKGKRVSTGSPGSATEVMAFRVIEAAGLDKDKDMRRERLGVAESVNALKDRKIDAFFWVGGLPTAAVTDLGATPGVKIKLIDTADLIVGDEQEIQRPLQQGHHQGRRLSRAGQGQRRVRGVEHPGGERDHVRRHGLQHREDADGEERRARGRASRGGELHARKSGAGELGDPVASRRGALLQGARRQDVTRREPFSRQARAVQAARVFIGGRHVNRAATLTGR